MGYIDGKTDIEHFFRNHRVILMADLVCVHHEGKYRVIKNRFTGERGIDISLDRLHELLQQSKMPIILDEIYVEFE